MAAQFVGAPDDQRERGYEQQHVGCERNGAEEALERGRVDQDGRDSELERDPPEQQAVAEDADRAQRGGLRALRRSGRRRRGRTTDRAQGFRPDARGVIGGYGPGITYRS